MSKKRPRHKAQAPKAPAPLSNSYPPPPPKTALLSSATPGAGLSAFVAPEQFHALVGLGLAIAFVMAIPGLATPLLLGVTLAALLSPVVSMLETRRIPRAVGAGLALLGILVIGALFTLMFLPRLVRELTELVLRVPDAVRRLLTLVEENTGFVLPQNFAALVEAFSARFEGEWKEQIGKVLQASSSLFGEHAGDVFAGVSAVVGTVGQALLVPVITYFVLVEVDALATLAYRFAPVLVQRVVVRHGPGVKVALMSLVKGQLLVALAMSGIYVVGLLLSSVPLALAIALLSGLAYVIPFASGAVCIVFSALFILLEPGLSPLGPLVGVVITAIVVQLLEGWVLTPRIVGNQAGLSPLAVILAVLIFGELFGFLGVLFALPVASVVGVIIRERAQVSVVPARVEG
jgi:predicted PurR-regulated permease PerM